MPRPAAPDAALNLFIADFAARYGPDAAVVALHCELLTSPAEGEELLLRARLDSVVSSLEATPSMRFPCRWVHFPVAVAVACFVARWGNR